jgi:hypothetical protein
MDTGKKISDCEVLGQGGTHTQNTEFKGSGIIPYVL